MTTGFFSIGIENIKTTTNYGTLFRTAYIYGASSVFVTGHRFKKQSSDTSKSYKNIPTYVYDDFEQLYENLPYGCQLIGVELTDQSTPLKEFKHPKQAMYILGAEDIGLSKQAISKCHHLVQLPGNHSVNVAVAGSLVLYDRIVKNNTDSYTKEFNTLYRKQMI